MAKFVSAPTHFRNLNMLQSYGSIYVVELLLVKRNSELRLTLHRCVDSMPTIARSISDGSVRAKKLRSS